MTKSNNLSIEEQSAVGEFILNLAVHVSSVNDKLCSWLVIGYGAAITLIFNAVHENITPTNANYFVTVFVSYIVILILLIAQKYLYISVTSARIGHEKGKELASQISNLPYVFDQLIAATLPWMRWLVRRKFTATINAQKSGDYIYMARACAKRAQLQGIIALLQILIIIVGLLSIIAIQKA